ncbi:MAG: NifB/NifX family molybdenum-iron cluster-binding protein [Anaerolineae bacterium]
MRIAVSVDKQRGLDSTVNPHFGRCPYFALVDVAERVVGAVEVIANPYYGNHQPGQVPAFVHEVGADVMITGGMGERAAAFFSQYGIEAVTGAAGTAGEAIAQYLGGALQGWAPCSQSQEHNH